MKIKTVRVNYHKNCFEITTAKGELSLPFAKVSAVPSPKDRVKKIYVDPELGKEAVTYELESGKEDSIHIDAFLEYNKDPDTLKKTIVYNLTAAANELMDLSGVGKRELARRMGTSPAQLYRLLDTAFYGKTIDQMVKLVSVLGFELEFKIKNRDAKRDVA